MTSRPSKAGRSDSVAADDPTFPDFFAAYQAELNEIGKRADLLIYRKSVLRHLGDPLHDDAIPLAAAAIEVRSSSFLAVKYDFAERRNEHAELEFMRIREELLTPPLAPLLIEKAPGIHAVLAQATPETLRDVTFRRRSWSSSPTLREMTIRLAQLKDHIKVLQKRDHLSITPKLEDIALVNRWVQRYGVRHFYLQVVFDKAYVISFKRILKTISRPAGEGRVFSVEEDVKNQNKTTFKINVAEGREILGRIDMPHHQSAVRELDRGRLLFYVTFSGGQGYLDADVFAEEVANAG